MARTTLDLDATVLRQLRARGRRERKSMGALASEILARGLSEPAHTTARHKFEWRTWDMGTPLVDLEDKEAVRRALDGDDG